MEIYTEKTIDPFVYTNLIHSTPQNYHTHTFWEFAMIITGKAANVMLGAPRVELTRGDVMIFRPRDCHYIRPLTHQLSYTHRDVYVSDESMRKICDALGANLYETLRDAPLPSRFRLDEIELINLNNHFNYFLNVGGRNPAADAIHSALTGYMLGLYLKSTSLSEKTMPQWLSNFLFELHDPKVFTLQIPEIIEKSNYSHSYVCSRFKYYLHKTLNEYVLDLRMNYAASLLISPNFSVLEVAMLLKYTSPGNFIAAFKKRFNVTPKQWQKNQTKNTV